jgi:hypothetical protein
MVLVDANVLLDIFTNDPLWNRWSTSKLRSVLISDNAALNPIIYAEISLAFGHSAELEDHIQSLAIRKLDLPYKAAFDAGRAFLKYRRAGGERRSPLPDFYIGAHASVAGFTLLTRDANRYSTYFPSVKLIAPE